MRAARTTLCQPQLACQLGLANCYGAGMSELDDVVAALAAKTAAKAAAREADQAWRAAVRAALAAGVSQADLARVTGVSREWLRKIAA